MRDMIIELEEYRRALVPRDSLPEELGLLLHREYSKKIEIEFPTIANDYNWRLTSLGWVGQIRLSKEISLKMLPKVSLKNIFGMLEYAYDLKSFDLRQEIDHYGSIEELFERLVKILSMKVLLRIKRGLYGNYIPYTDSLSYVRGRLETDEIVRKPWNIRPICSYEDHTRDVEENQILVWTMKWVIMSGIVNQETLLLAQKAYRSLRQIVAEIPYDSSSCVSRLYNRLNDDYRPMHLLCRFFLENCGPSLENGDRQSVAFTVNMARLYELFVARWLESHLNDSYTLKAQEKVSVSGGTLQFNIDLVLYDRYTGKAVAVMDTKYKTRESPSNADFYQVTTYALSKGCDKAFLIYPSDLKSPFHESVNNIQVRSLTFPLSGNLESNGEEFMEQLHINLKR